MNILRTFIVFLLSFSASAQSTFFTGGNICKNENWHLVFNDEFDGDSLDRTKWVNYFPYTATGNDQCEFCRTHGNEGEIYTDTNLEVSNGTLKLIARRQTATWFSATRDYTSGLIYSKGQYKYMYGRFEIRCKIPSGMGFWPSFWMFGSPPLPSGIATEIDIFEFGCQKPYHQHLGIAEWNASDKVASYDYSLDTIDLSLNFHVFAVQWDPFFIKFKVDDNQIFEMSRFYTIDGTQVTWCCVNPGEYNVLPAYPQGLNNYINIIAGLGIGVNGGPFTDAPNSSTVFPNQLEIDYIRVYQQDTATTDNECEVLLYPNPVHSNLFIKSGHMTSILIENVLGQVVFQSNVDGTEIQINISFLPKGVYITEVETDNGPLVGKFIKQ